MPMTSTVKGSGKWRSRNQPSENRNEARSRLAARQPRIYSHYDMARYIKNPVPDYDTFLAKLRASAVQSPKEVSTEEGTPCLSKSARAGSIDHSWGKPEQSASCALHAD